MHLIISYKHAIQINKIFYIYYFFFSTKDKTDYDVLKEHHKYFQISFFCLNFDNFFTFCLHIPHKMPKSTKIYLCFFLLVIFHCIFRFVWDEGDVTENDWYKIIIKLCYETNNRYITQPFKYHFPLNETLLFFT